MEEQEIKVKNETYQCPKCGGNMAFDPQTQSLYCEYCGNRISLMGEHSDVENDFSQGIENDEKWDNEAIVFHCKNCGANNIRQKNDLTSVCPFCGSKSVIESEELPGIKPQRIIPFKIAKEYAFDAFQKKAKKSFFAPRDFKKNFNIDKFNGAYLPTWTFDTNVFASYKGRLGKYYTVTVGTGKNRHTETRIKWFNIEGTKQFSFDDLFVLAGNRLNEKQIKPILPFDTNNSFIYKQEYVSGFSAEHYDIDLKDGWEIAKANAMSQMKTMIANSYNHDIVDYINIKPVYSDIKYKYVLVPTWIANYRYHNKNYYFIVNGENGKISSKTPISILKVFITILIIIAIFAVAALIIIKTSDNNSDEYIDYMMILRNYIRLK